MAAISIENEADIMRDLQRRVPFLPRKLRVLCTRSPQRPLCQLLDHLEAYNNTLLYLGVQLREDEKDDLGELRLVALQPPPQGGRLIEHKARVANGALQWLLTLHQCIVGVDVIYGIAESARLTKVLMRCRGVRKLNVVYCEGLRAQGERYQEQSVSELIASLDRIEELAIGCQAVRINSPVIVDPSCFYLTRSRFIIDLVHIKVSTEVATNLVAQLIKDSALRSLAVGPEIFEVDIFPKYLAKENHTLRSLALISGSTCDPAILRTLATAISRMSTLEELVVGIQFSATEEIAIFADVVAQNKTLRVLSLTHAATSVEHELFAYPHRSTDNQPDTAKAWVRAFQDNSTLQRLTVDFLNFEQSTCHAFFRAIAKNRTLKHVTVVNLPCRGGQKEIYGTIRDCGLEQRVLVKSHCLDSSTLLKFPENLEVTAAVVDRAFQKLNLYTVLNDLCRCSHVTSLHLRTDRKLLVDSVSHMLAAFIGGTSNLRKLWMHVYGEFNVLARFGHYVAPSTLVAAICSNKNLNSLTLYGIHMAEPDCRMLVEAAVRSSNLHHLEMIRCGDTNALFVRLLAPAIARCYNLLRVRVPVVDAEHYNPVLVVQEVTRRNSSLVIRATRFVMGDDRSYCARALDLVSGHPKLVEMVAEGADVSCGDAKAMIRRALSSIASLNAFMRAAGVVKHRVECSAGPDCQTQLDELNDDCWLHVRKYLKVADVHEHSPVSAAP